MVGNLSLGFYAVWQFTLANCFEDLLLSMRDVVCDALRLDLSISFLDSYIRGLAYNFLRFRGFNVELSSLNARIANLERCTSQF